MIIKACCRSQKPAFHYSGLVFLLFFLLPLVAPTNRITADTFPGNGRTPLEVYGPPGTYPYDWDKEQFVRDLKRRGRSNEEIERFWSEHQKELKKRRSTIEDIEKHNSEIKEQERERGQEAYRQHQK